MAMERSWPGGSKCSRTPAPFGRPTPPQRTPAHMLQPRKQAAMCKSTKTHKKKTATGSLLPSECQSRSPEGEGVPSGLGLGLSEVLPEGDPAAWRAGQGRRRCRGLEGGWRHGQPFVPLLSNSASNGEPCLMGHKSNDFGKAQVG